MTAPLTLRALIVEDSADDEILLLRELRRAGFAVVHQRVQSADGLRAALAAERWDVVLSDYQMPRFNGLDAFAVAQDWDPNLPFIIVSGTIGEEVAVDAMKLGVHDYLMKGNYKRLGPAIRRELQDAEVRRQRRWGIERLEHLNRVLRAIRSVNQLIVRERDPQRLIEGACQVLVETRGYQAAWIAVLERPGHGLKTASAGFGQAFERLRSNLAVGVLPDCAVAALAGSDVVRVDEHEEVCAGCPLMDGVSRCGSLTCRLESNGHVYGLLSVNLPPKHAIDDDQTSLIAEIAGDVAFALASIESEVQRGQAEAQLAFAAARWNDTFDAVTNPVSVISAEHEFLQVNAAVCAALGRPREEIVGRKCYELVHGVDVPIGGCPIAGLKAGGRGAGDLEEDGRSYRLRAWPMRDPDGRVLAYAHVSEDVTEARNTELERQQALRETEALLRCNRMLVDSKNFAKTARHVFDEMLSISGATAGYLALLSLDKRNNEVQFLESGGRTCTVDPSLPMPIRGLRAEAYQRGEAVFDNAFGASEHWALMPKGHVTLDNVLFVPLKTDGEAVGLFGLANKPGGFTDHDAKTATAFAEVAAIALREERTRSALAESEERLQRIFASTAEYIMLLDRDHRIQLVNRVEPGVTQDDIVGTPLYDIADPKHRDAARRALDRAVRERTPQTYDTVYTRPEGMDIYFTSVASPVVVGDEVVGTVVTSRDMTERRMMEAQLAQADRLSSMGMLAAGVAHEINNPLAYILYNLESLSEDLPKLTETYLAPSTAQAGAGHWSQTPSAALSPPTLDEILAKFKDALEGTQRIRDIARGLGTFSRVERDQLAPVDLKYVIEAALNMCFNEIKYRARVVKDFGRVPSILGSEGRLSQVFLNLFVNAAHAIDEGDVEANELRVRLWAAREADQDVVYAEVRDTGRGIAPEHLGKLFDPFFTTKEVGVGSGLGLPISKGIVESYGGTITVRSERGRGAAFTLRFPIKTREVTQKPVPSVATAEAVVRGRVLIVDDEDGIRAAMADMLREHETVQANNGDVARKILEQDQAFDLIVCDLMMPQFSGMDLHEWLREHHPQLARQLIFITGGAFTPRARAYLSAVDNLRIEKPFDAKNFVLLVADKVRLTKSKVP